MQPIIILGAAVVGVALLGTGFLSDGEPWNEFEIWLQQLGFGEAMLESPVSHATVDLEIKKVLTEGDEFSGDYYRNVIEACTFHSDTTIPAVTGNGAVVGKIICKILDEHQRAFAEGHIEIPLTGYIGSTTPHWKIPIDMCADSNTPNDSTPDCLDVQAPIHGVKLVVEAPVGMAIPLQ